MKLLFLGFFLIASCAINAQVVDNPLATASTHQPHEYGVFVQGGNGVTDMRGGFHFLSAGVHAGRVLTNNFGSGVLRSNFEYAVEVMPYWQSFTPKFQRVSCALIPGSTVFRCSQPYTVGGTYTGASVTPIILRINSARRGRLVPWIQGAGGVLWTNHKYPAYGNTTLNLSTNGPDGETSVWNFTPQFGVGAHLFTRPGRSVDFSANAVHISSASLGDRNPGVNVSLQFAVGYSFWK
ncbi:MAG: acyloxyacyl hydrolase [Janthinobacterium lividum]